MDWSKRRHRFRDLLAGGECVTPATVFDPLSARMIEDLGGQVGMLAGSVAAMAILGAPDRMLITASEFSDMAYRICRAADLAVIADADHGYGNAMNVQRTVRDLDHAGLAAITIEDTNLPHPYGTSGASLLPIDEAVGKMKAAVSGRDDPNLVILARTSAATISGHDDCMARIKAYEKTGVDGITLIGMPSVDDLHSLCSATSLPLMLGGLSSLGNKMPDNSALAALGARICLRGHQPYMAALAATYQSLQSVLGLCDPADAPDGIAADLLRQLTRDEVYHADAAEFLDSKG